MIEQNIGLLRQGSRMSPYRAASSSASGSAGGGEGGKFRGDTLRFAERMQLIQMEPHDDLSSTGYALANPGKEYLVLEPSETAAPFTVTLAAGTYTVQWYGVDSRETVEAGEVTVDSPTTMRFSAPFEAAGPAVLYLKQVER